MEQGIGLTALEPVMCHQCHDFADLETDWIVEVYPPRSRFYCHTCWFYLIRPRWKRYLMKKFKKVRYLRLMNYLYGKLWSHWIQSWPVTYRVDTMLNFRAEHYIFARGRQHPSLSLLRREVPRGQSGGLATSI